MREINRGEVPKAGADDLPAPEIAVRHPAREPSVRPAPGAAPARRRELTFRTVATAMVVAVIVGGSYPYVVLKIGFGPNISVVSAFFGYLALAGTGLFTGIRGTRWENNLVQTAGTAAGEAGFHVRRAGRHGHAQRAPRAGLLRPPRTRRCASATGSAAAAGSPRPSASNGPGSPSC